MATAANEWTDDWEDELDAKRRVVVRKVVAFELDDELYGIDIAKAAEILRLVPIRAVPNVPDFVLGLINLRGSIVPVIDLRILFKLRCRPWNSESRIVVIKHEEMLVGAAVDRLWDVLRLSPEAFQPPPPDMAAIDAEYFREICPIEGRMLILLNTEKILNLTAGK
jgi:purine-binding chemotaxis protein CheW